MSKDIKEFITIDEIVAMLNSALKVDQKAISELMLTDVRVKEDMIDHPTIPVRANHGLYTVNPIAILNGAFKAQGIKGIRYETEDRRPSVISRFYKVI